jgi:hypothetical protein
MRKINIVKPFDFGIVMSNIAFEGSFNLIPSKYVFENFNEEVIKNMVKIQKDNISKSITKRYFLILDDCIAEDKMKQPIIKKLAIMGGHYNITTILTTLFFEERDKTCPCRWKAKSWGTFQGCTHSL